MCRYVLVKLMLKKKARN